VYIGNGKKQLSEVTQQKMRDQTGSSIYNKTAELLTSSEW